MKIPREDREELIKKIDSGDISIAQVAKEYGVGQTAVYNMIARFKSDKPTRTYKPAPNRTVEMLQKHSDIDIEAYKNMTKEELIDELILAKANELRAKKGYEVKGVGANKEFIFLNNENSK